MDKWWIEEKLSKLDNKTFDSKVSLLYQWAKTGVINLKEFNYLMMCIGEKVSTDETGCVTGMRTGRVVAKFSHVQEAKSFVKVANGDDLCKDIIERFNKGTEAATS